MSKVATLTRSTVAAWARNEDVIELIEAILLSFTTVATAWSAYQAALWDGEQSAHYTEASAARADANRLSDRANTQVAIDLSEYEVWLAAETVGDVQLAALLRGQMREELRVALDAWLEAGGLERTKQLVPASPFSMPEYQLADRAEADALVTAAEGHFAEGEEANRRSDKYVLVTVVFALVLFIVGIGSKFKNLRVRLGLAGFATLALLLGTITLILLPVAALTP